MQGETLSDRIGRLSDGQRDCLRLVAEHRSSKEIARLLSISPHTVDQRLKRAVSILAVTSRFEAARLLFDDERDASATPGSLYQSLIYQRPDLHSPSETDENALSPGEPNPLGDGAVRTLHEAQAGYFAGVPQAETPALLSVLKGAHYENDLPASWRLAIILGIMLAGIAGFSVLVNLVEGLSRIY